MTGDEHDRAEGDQGQPWGAADDEGSIEHRYTERADEALHGAASRESDRLALADDEERLPWLESAGDDVDDRGSDTGRFMGLVGVSLAALAAIVFGLWWATHRTPDPALVADGSTIEAPKEPYKEAPANPGGKTFDGTGDSSFAVSEGKSKPAKMGDGGAAPAVAAAPAATHAARPAGAAPAPGSSGGVGVQVGAFSSKAAAEAGWDKLVSQSQGALSGVSHRVIEGSADIGKVYRLQAVAGDSSAANSLCSRLKGAGISCQVK
ncbi:MAG: SPOR domain-containing protein [Proteobacteria bacterium]|nr:SPOR domain-containing protein [Pseudomonadota bacterium]